MKALLLTACLFCALNAPALNASYFGFVSDGSDNLPAMKWLADYCRTNGNATVTWDAGNYVVTQTESWEGYAIPACSIRQATNMVLDASAATFIYTNAVATNEWSCLFKLMNCTNVTIKAKAVGAHTCGTHSLDGGKLVWLYASNDTVNITLTATKMLDGVRIGEYEDPQTYAYATYEGNHDITVTATNIDTYYGVAAYLANGLTVTNVSLGTSTNGYGALRAVYINGCNDVTAYSWSKDMLVQDAVNLVASGPGALTPFHYGCSNVTIHATDMGTTLNTLYQSLFVLGITSSTQTGVSITNQNITLDGTVTASATVWTNLNLVMFNSLGTASHWFTNITVTGNYNRGGVNAAPAMQLATAAAGLAAFDLHLTDYTESTASAYTFSTASSLPVHITGLRSTVNQFNFANPSQQTYTEIAEATAVHSFGSSSSGAMRIGP